MSVLSMESAATGDCVNNNAHPPPYSNEPDEYEEGSLEEMRRIAQSDSSISIPEIDIASFLSHLLPPVKNEINVLNVVSLLKSEKLVTSKGKWRHFDTNPAHRVEEEDVGCKIEPTFVLDLVPDAMLRPQRASATHPDGYFILKEAEERSRNATIEKEKFRWWYDIALTFECKKVMGVRDFDDNVSRLVFNMQQTMTLDASRRFTFGVTIENTRMRLWFCSRATVVVSKAFDFTVEVELLTEILLRLAFASKEELGWDLTIRPFIRSDGICQYEIDVDTETYVTEQVLSDSVADALISHGTRVWRARSLRSGDVVVLKDVWVEDNRLLEHEIYDMILCDVEEKFGEDVRKEAASHLLTPVAHWLVSVNGVEDHTRKVMMRGYVPLLEQRLKIKLKRRECIVDDSIEDLTERNGASTTSGRPIIQELGAPFPHRLNRRRRYRRKHYRIVFKEVASTLHAVQRLSSAFLVLRDVAKALKWIHGSGWVHRDISAGNLYFYNGRGILGDLEYAKRRNSDMSREFRIGTLDFMAVEAIAREHIYTPIGAYQPYCESRSEEEAESQWLLFFHNDLHDLESLSWAAVWLLFFHPGGLTPDPSKEDEDDRRRRRQATLYALFPGTDIIVNRMTFFKGKWKFFVRLSWVSNDLLGVVQSLNTLRSGLLHKYKSFESQFPVINTEVFEGTQDEAYEWLEASRKCAEGVELSRRQFSNQQGISRESHADRWHSITMPSLEDDADERSSGDSSSELVSDAHKSVFSRSGTDSTGKCSEPRLLPVEDDYLTPMPFVCVAKYAVEVC